MNVEQTYDGRWGETAINYFQKAALLKTCHVHSMNTTRR